MSSTSTLPYCKEERFQIGWFLKKKERKKGGIVLSPLWTLTLSNHRVKNSTLQKKSEPSTIPRYFHFIFVGACALTEGSMPSKRCLSVLYSFLQPNYIIVRRIEKVDVEFRLSSKNERHVFIQIPGSKSVLTRDVYIFITESSQGRDHRRSASKQHI